MAPQSTASTSMCKQTALHHGFSMGCQHSLPTFWLVHTSQHLPQSQWLGLGSWPILSDCFSNHGTWKGGQLIAGQPLDCGKRFYHLHSLSHLSNVLALSRMRKLWHGGTGLPSAPFSGQASRPPRFLKNGQPLLGNIQLCPPAHELTIWIPSHHFPRVRTLAYSAMEDSLGAIKRPSVAKPAPLVILPGIGIPALS